MTRLITHRGPDGFGHFFDRNLALGHRRLAIIDLTTDGHQPMSYMDGRYVITYNGEIYNYIEIRAELQELGHIFHSRSDTEVILAAYVQWGEACVQRFNGMWAFVIYDKERKILFGSRDRYGVKPFYYAQQDGFFAFASEVRQLLTLLPSVKADRQTLLEFLLTSFSDHTERTFFAGVTKLGSSHNCIYELDSNHFRSYRYYDIPFRPEIARLDERQAVEAYGSILRDAVRLRLRSDVRVGTCLSGGLDSSSVATLAETLYSRDATVPFSAITAVSEQENNDESRYAARVVEHSGLNWIRVKPTYEDFRESLPAVIKTQEEPFAGVSISMQYFVMQAARQNGITVLLDGQGGDETLLGYEKYYAAYYVSLLRRHGVISMIKGVRRARANNTKMGLLNSLKNVVGGLSAPARYWFYRFRHNYLDLPDEIPWYLRAFAKASLDEFALQKLEVDSTNLPILLRYEDKNSMAHAIEARLPFIDYRVLETALSLPGEYKIRDGWSKWVLRRVMSGHMPDDIVWRRNKMGFEAPEELWLSKHFPEMVRVVTGSSLLGTVADMDRIGRTYLRLDKRSQWRLYSVAMWESSFGVGA